MKHLNLLILLLIFIIKTAETFKYYHGNRQHWTYIFETTEETYVDLNMLNEKIKIFFSTDPARRTIPDILSDIKLYSYVVNNPECKREKTTNLGFTLDFGGDRNYIRGETFFEGPKKEIWARFFDSCNGGEQQKPYKTNSTDEIQLSLEGDGRVCFQNDENPLRVYDKDETQKVIELEATGKYSCPIFLVLPAYMFVEDYLLPANDIRLPLNESYAGHDQRFWWRKKFDHMLPNGVNFKERDLKIDLVETSKATPIYIRIGSNQPIPPLRFTFSSPCDDHYFELYLNLRRKEGKDDCRVLIHVIDEGYELITRGGIVTKVRDPILEPTLIYDRYEDKLYLKAERQLLMIPIDICSIENPTDVPADQIVLELHPWESTCYYAQLTLRSRDVISNTIEVLIDRTKLPTTIKPPISTTNNSINVTVPSKTPSAVSASIGWWWFVAYHLYYLF